MHSLYCQNCNAALIADSVYCNQCGQAAHVHRLSLSHLFHEAVHYFTHADKGIFHTTRALALQPGITAKEYIEGKRKKYFPPLNFLLIVAGLYVFSVTFFHLHSRSDRNISQQEQLNKIRDPKIKARVVNVQNTLNKYSNLIFMLATPLISFIIFLFYWKGPYNFTEHLVANLYFVGFTSLLITLIVAPVNALFRTPLLYGILMGIYFLFEIIYRGYAYVELMDARTTASKIKAYAVSLFVVVFWSVLSFYLVKSYIRNGVWGVFD